MKNIYNHDPVALDPEGKIRDIANSTLDISIYKDKLNLGCGADYLEGYTNLDGSHAAKAELYCELDSEQVRIPVKDMAFDYIYASHILEHIWYLPQLKKELTRILKPNGVVVIVVPDYSSVDAWGDDTHCRAFSICSFTGPFWKGMREQHTQYINVTTPGDFADRKWICAVVKKND